MQTLRAISFDRCGFGKVLKVSSMFGGYTELFAYGQETDKDGDQKFNISTAESTDCPSSTEKCLPFGGFRTWPHPRKDFIILAECSETCGPVPILTIPHNVSAIDLNEFTVQILSSDYQGLGSGEGISTEDTQLLKPDAMKDIHTMINYLVLLDSQARGFVRPLCIAYVTSDKYKLMQNSRHLFKALTQASNFLKEYNRKLFLYEAQSLIQDLEYTKAEYMKELSEESSCAKLELLESTLKEVQHSYHNICHWKIDERTERLHKRFGDCLQKFLGSKYMDLKNQIMHSRNFNLSHKPNIIRLPIHRNFDSGLRPHSEICLSGFPLAVYQLYITYKFFRRKNENILLGLRDKEFQGQLLHFGACLRPSYSALEMELPDVYSACADIVPDIPQKYIILEDMNFHFDCIYVDLVLSTNQISFKKKINSLTESTYEETQKSDYKLESLQRGNAKVKNTSNTTLPCLWHGFSLGNMWDVIDEYHADGSEHYFQEMLQKFFFTQHILYSLLIGRPVAIVGVNNHSSELQIRALVKCLGLLVPRTRRNPLWMELWRTTILGEKDIKTLAIVGLGCAVNHNIESLIPPQLMAHFTILDVTCFSFTGPYYSGCLLGDVDKKLKCLPQNGPVLSVLMSILANIEMKVQFWQHCLKSLGNTAAASDHFLNNDFSKHDFHIIQKLGESLEDA